MTDRSSDISVRLKWVSRPKDTDVRKRLREAMKDEIPSEPHHIQISPTSAESDLQRKRDNLYISAENYRARLAFLKKI
ncbi:MAG TPA: hypothetical protein VMY43_08770 [Methanothrix sp.]|nr:hypothetical protein [Methanothrix sp.]